jgi:D-sedoheptulose 7-phosphate isomerase
VTGAAETIMQPAIFIQQELEKAKRLVENVRTSPKIINQITEVAQACAEAFRGNNKMMIAGNGGSAADAQHWAAELVGRFYYDRPALPAIALTTDTSILTAVANDYEYEYVFARQIEAIGNAGDVLIAISTSGRSRNVIRALQAATAKNMITVGMTGGQGDEMKKFCTFCLQIPANETPRIQEGHEIVGHILCALIERMLFPTHHHSAQSNLLPIRG